MKKNVLAVFIAVAAVFIQGIPAAAQPKSPPVV
ncbi:MAG: hypothetical protein H6P95_2080, partial [Candidatus Aminicenantes bacterium]|nr:hypothetical protein [Candidatus Aminicenantes bacterium]